MNWTEIIIGSLNSAIGALVGGLVAFSIARYQIKNQNKKELNIKEDLRHNSKLLILRRIDNFHDNRDYVMRNLSNLGDYSILTKVVDKTKKITEIKRDIENILVSEKHYLMKEDILNLNNTFHLIEWFNERILEFINSDTTEREELIIKIEETNDYLQKLYREF